MNKVKKPSKVKKGKDIINAKSKKPSKVKRGEDNCFDKMKITKQKE